MHSIQRQGLYPGSTVYSFRFVRHAKTTTYSCLIIDIQAERDNALLTIRGSHVRNNQFSYINSWRTSTAWNHVVQTTRTGHVLLSHFWFLVQFEKILGKMKLKTNVAWHTLGNKRKICIGMDLSTQRMMGVKFCLSI